MVFVAVTYGPDGCYDMEEYIAVVNIGNKFQEYSNIIGYLMMMVGAFGIIGNSSGRRKCASITSWLHSTVLILSI